ncbi:MAG: adenylate/guanylate cyclase domain-containing protein, partial [Bacteroidota bacterium]
MKYRITYASIGYEAEVTDDYSSLLDISIDNQIPHTHECGGHGRCTTCRVRVLEGHGNLSAPTNTEKSTAFARKWDPSIRLACQAYPKGDVTLQRLIWSSAEINKLQIEMAPEGRAEERPVAILFCDLRNFTSMSSQNMNFDIAYLLNKFYTALGEPILMNNGIIYQYVGDEIVGVFGTAGGTKEKNCMDAIRAAITMQYALERLNRIELSELDIKLKSGIGVNFGKAYVGHLGHPTHRQFSVIGDPVNVASRVQSQTKKTGADILISESVYKSVNHSLLKLGNAFSSQVAGKEERIELYEVLGFKGMDLQLELQASINHLLKEEEKFAALFYDKVFERAPQARSMFRNSMANQGKMLTHMLGSIVYSLSRPEHLTLGLKKLGKSHVKYGVEAAHYPVVKEAMLET